ncbi:pancreatic triacylglycerol lipase-like [Anopheles aquasalis]|uniref:pancreatic triacylglycerol lipase-like n=1 Tax=Anopheles aquasalis TaxID=42839 RepID=UPI00215AFDD6|nr:pancreatic triacylglycerol lipase-like [Anopheles aquasalis]
MAGTGTVLAPTGAMVNQTDSMLSLLLLHFASLTLNNTSNNTVIEEKCYGMYGCFRNDMEWTSARRPIALHPQTVSEIDTRFAVFNDANRTHPYFLDNHFLDADVHELRSGGAGITRWINPTGPLYFITHGFLESGKTKWIERMLNLLLNRDRNATVIVIDWGKGSNPPYNQACANIRLVGAITAHIIDKIKKVFDMPNLDRVHLIGHSLGSHLAGYTGYTLISQFQQKLGRITGLDPAELAFTETDRVVRLDPSDAKFVDIVHSDATPFVPQIGLGLYEPIGHVDFYPNGGSDQPGCRHEFWKNADTRFVTNMFQFFSCSHSRAYEYFIESLEPERAALVAVSCSDYGQYLLGSGGCADCASAPHGCVRFGLESVRDYRARERRPDVPIQLFFRTASRAPFLMPNYRLTVRLSNTTASRQHGPEVGRIVLQLRTVDGGRSEKIFFNDNVIMFEPGHQYSSVVTVKWPGEPDERQESYDVARTSAVAVSWEYETSLLNPLSWRLIATPRVYLESITVRSMGGDIVHRLCPLPNKPINSIGQTLLSECQPPSSGYKMH